ncbi:YdbL family protein [Hahella ganghwensis]|uniref:YdbL family protein n=1 Tax=Hahella ganghwensis TaxID=286420 RepID=UPI0003716308|nr:YdbL family protein [Hahella ganghwensis]
MNGFEKTMMKFKALLLVVTLLFAGGALALELDEAKAKGLVGEQADGYVGAVKPSPEVNALVADINGKRAKAYARIGQKNGVAVDKVGELAAKKLINKAGPNEYVKTPSGTWVLKKEIK